MNADSLKNRLFAFSKTKLALPVFAGTGLVLAFIIVSFVPETKHSDSGAPAPVAEYIEARARPFVPRATGYGFAEPTTVLEASAEVSGRITFMNPKVKAGALLQAGTELLRIDPTDYELSLAEAHADLAVARAQKEEQSALLISAQTAFEIAERNLLLGEANLERKRNLLNNSTISQASLDQEEQGVLKLRQEKQSRRQQLETLPSQIDVASARIKQSQARLVEQQERLARTKISLPFTARIAGVHVEQGEYVNAGGRLFDAHSVDSVEITTKLSIGSLQNLMAGMGELAPGEKITTPSEMISQLGLQAEVVLPDRVFDARWKGTVIRIGESQDRETRTLALVVRVDDPYGQIIPGVRPPLLRGMYVAVNLISNPLESLVVPRSAVHSGKIYVVSDNDTLVLRDVTAVFQGDIAVVRTGLTPGEKVIITDLIPAVEGMVVEPRLSQDASEALSQTSMHVIAGIR